MQEQFPSEELKTYEDFLLLLDKVYYSFYKVFCGDITAGYFLLLINKENRTLWLDYIAVFKGKQSSGIGTDVFSEIKVLFPDYKGIYIEVEKENIENFNTKRRADFYKKVGAKKLDFKYYFPTNKNHLEMDLYFLSFEDKNILPEPKATLETVEYAFNTIHSRVKHFQDVFNLIKNTNKK